MSSGDGWEDLDDEISTCDECGEGGLTLIDGLCMACQDSDEFWDDDDSWEDDLDS